MPSTNLNRRRNNHSKGPSVNNSFSNNTRINRSRDKKSSLLPSRYTAASIQGDSCHQSKSSSILHETGQNSPIRTATLYQLHQTRPPLKLMRQWVREAFGDPEMSPTLIDDVIYTLDTYSTKKNSMIQSDSQAHPENSPHEIHGSVTQSLPQADEITHIPGWNDHMTGGKTPDSRQPILPLNDALDCSDDFFDQINYMPWRILNARSLALIPELFKDKEDCVNVLGPDFLITNAGVWRAVADVRMMISFVDPSQQDTLVLGALARRGGRRDENDRRPVFYPEHMHPILWEYSGLCDQEYWDALYAQGESFLTYIEYALRSTRTT